MRVADLSQSRMSVPLNKAQSLRNIRILDEKIAVAQGVAMNNIRLEQSEFFNSPEQSIKD